MDKNSFIEKIGGFGGVSESVLLPKLYDKIILGEKTGKTIFTNEFYPPIIWEALIKIQSHFDISLSCYGIFDDADRRIIGINSKSFKDYPVSLVKIKATSKFTSVEHKDFLGAIMSLGIKREKFGDLILKEGICYCALHLDTRDYLLYNLDKVKNSPCKVEILDLNSKEKPNHQFEFINILATSKRLDCIVSSLCNISRNSSNDLIRQGKVQVDYFPMTKADLLLNLNNLIVIRGYGKFRFNEITGTTSSGRLKIKFKKFI